MNEIISTEIMVCNDCLQAIANDDYTGLDYYLEPAEAEQRMHHIQQRLSELGEVVVGDYYINPQAEDIFSTQPCECCHSDLHGLRVACLILEWAEE